MLRVLHVSTYDDHGGAARAAYRLFSGLEGKCDLQFVTKSKKSDNSAVLALSVKQNSYIRSKIFQLKSVFRKPPGELYLPSGFSVPADDLYSSDLIEAVTMYQPDVVHLHWLCNQFLSLEELARIRQPVVWTLHDSWPFTGGCHIPGDCKAYFKRCGNCPVLSSCRSDDLSHFLYQAKKQVYSKIDLTLVSPSRWLADCARQSSLFCDKNIEVIPHGLDLGRFHPVERAVARQVLGLPEDQNLVLFGGMSSTSDPNKGYNLLVEALSAIDDQQWLNRTRLLIFGAAEDERPVVSLPVEQQHFGYISNDNYLSMLYSAADVMVVPSRLEAFGQTAMEALACGTPVVCFRTTGLLDIVDHQNNGYLAALYNSADLARGLIWATDPARREELRCRARHKAEQAFAAEKSASRYMELYKKLSLSVNR